MQFSRKEMAALLKAAKLMALADGKMSDDEKDVIKADLGSFGVKLDTINSILLEEEANKMDGSEVIATLSTMSLEQKKYACGYLATVMVADGKIDDKENLLWCLISRLADFPTMSIGDAVLFWNNH